MSTAIIAALLGEIHHPYEATTRVFNAGSDAKIEPVTEP